MTDRTSKTLQALVQDFFLQHLAVEREAGKNTVGAYRDAIKLFLAHASSLRGRAPDQLDHTVLDVETVRSFLAWLKRERGCGANTRNHRSDLYPSRGPQGLRALRRGGSARAPRALPPHPRAAARKG